MAMPEITIYHLEGRRSERIVWLMEELGLPYTLKFKQGDLAGSMAPIRADQPGNAGGADRHDRQTRCWSNPARSSRRSSIAMHRAS